MAHIGMLRSPWMLGEITSFPSNSSAAIRGEENLLIYSDILTF